MVIVEWNLGGLRHGIHARQSGYALQEISLKDRGALIVVALISQFE